MTKEHIRALRESRRVFVKDKLVDFDGNFVEHVHHEKGVWVAPIDDPILEELDSLQIYEQPIFDEEVGRWVNYDYSSLSWRLKKYMQEKDSVFFDRWYKKQKFKDIVPVEEFDKRIQRLEKEKGELSNEDIEAILVGKRKTSTYKKARDSARRAYASLIGLIRANLDKFNAFVTLTFARKENEEKYKEFGANFRYVSNPKDFREVKEKFSSFINTLSKNMRRKGLDFQYVATWEMHADGSFHFHMICTAIPDDLLCDAPEWLDVDFKTGKRRNGKMLIHWEYGKSDYDLVRDRERMSTYISKYVLKSLRNIDEEHYETFLHAKKYFSSRGLERPKVSYVFTEKDFEKMMEKIKGYAETYPIEYENAYNGGKIVKNVYSKKWR
ncbi:rolling circle replication-associated protein (plasmid) [Parageobacillus thermoglucosidasius]|uniref:rolling circle replication-associated protein n=1 Tax=Parageobacillus thermoglucosidasius TaxID=1426 RepID=UPI003B674768